MIGTLVYQSLYFFISSMRRIGWWRLTTVGGEKLTPWPEGGMLLVMNHIHWLDILMLGALLPRSYRVSWLGKSELFDAHPIAAWFFRTMWVIPVRRGKRDIAALYTVADELRGGALLVVFPEGHRSGTGVLQEGKSGAIRMAALAGVPLLPLAITGTERGVGGLLRRQPITLHVGQPYTLPVGPHEKLPHETLAALTTDMMQRIAAMLPPAQRGPYQLATVEHSEQAAQAAPVAR